MRAAAFSSDAPPLYALRIVEIVMVGISLFVRKRKKKSFFVLFSRFLSFASSVLDLLLVGQRFFYVRDWLLFDWLSLKRRSFTEGGVWVLLCDFRAYWARSHVHHLVSKCRAAGNIHLYV